MENQSRRKRFWKAFRPTQSKWKESEELLHNTPGDLWSFASSTNYHHAQPAAVMGPELLASCTKRICPSRFSALKAYLHPKKKKVPQLGQTLRNHDKIKRRLQWREHSTSLWYSKSTQLGLRFIILSAIVLSNIWQIQRRIEEGNVGREVRGLRQRRVCHRPPPSPNQLATKAFQRRQAESRSGGSKRGWRIWGGDEQ